MGTRTWSQGSVVFSFFKLLSIFYLNIILDTKKSLEESADSLDMYLLSALEDSVHNGLCVVTDVIGCYCSNW